MPQPPSSITILLGHLMAPAAVCCRAQQGLMAEDQEVFWGEDGAAFE